MNALGVQVEAARRKPIMSRFHAFFSVGNFIGAGTVEVDDDGTPLDAAAQAELLRRMTAPVTLTVDLDDDHRRR